MTYKEKVDSTRSELRTMNKSMPETMSGFATMTKGVHSTGSLPLKEQEMIALGMAIAQRCEPCITLHVDSLMKLGGTREELLSILGVAVQMSGGPGMMYSGKALACWDEYAALKG